MCCPLLSFLLFFLYKPSDGDFSTTCCSVDQFRIATCKERRQAFYISYQPGFGETAASLAQCVERFVSVDHAIFRSTDIRDGVERFNFVLCLTQPMRVATIFSVLKWRRAQATGFICDVQYPRRRESVKGFVLRWASHVRGSGRAQRFSSQTSVIDLRDRAAVVQRQSVKESRARERYRRVHGPTTSRVRRSSTKCVNSNSGPSNVVGLVVEEDDTASASAFGSFDMDLATLQPLSIVPRILVLSVF